VAEELMPMSFWGFQEIAASVTIVFISMISMQKPIIPLTKRIDCFYPDILAETDWVLEELSVLTMVTVLPLSAGIIFLMAGYS
jgi:hypothetical protein